MFLQTSKLLLQYQNDDTNILLKICADVVWLFTESVQTLCVVVNSTALVRWRRARSVVCIVCCSQQHCTGSVVQSSVCSVHCVL